MRDPPAAIHIRPTAPLAPRVLLPGDPGRALALATELLAEPRMFNHHRGLWGYTGTAGDGEPLTIQSTGIGGPSAVIVFEELIALGATRAIRVGTARALEDALGPGDVLIVEAAICADGASGALGAGVRALPDGALTKALRACAPEAAAGTIVTSDLFHGLDTAQLEHWRASGARAVEMQAAALFALARLRGVAVACALAITDRVVPGRERTDAAADMHAAAIAAGRLGAAALRAA